MRLASLAAAILALFLYSELAWTADLSQPVLLVAKRNLKDRIYGNTILVARPIGEDRHVGFIVNKPSSMTLGKLFPQHGPSQKVVDPVYLGGPVGPEVIFAIVRGQRNPGGRSLRLAPGVYVAYETEVVDRIIEGQARDARFFAGMVLWRPNELVEEVKRGLWFVLDPQPEVLLKKPTDGLWEELVGRSELRANSI